MGTHGEPLGTLWGHMGTLLRLSRDTWRHLGDPLGTLWDTETLWGAIETLWGPLGDTETLWDMETLWGPFRAQKPFGEP